MLKIVLLATTLAVATPALADDRAPNAAETVALKKRMASLGYVSWEEVELDDDGPYWEIDDARKADGKRFDVRLAPRTLALIRAVADD
ncbi:PepSY domain-containing protein [Glacieibacterium frigidum]|uniref:PepSY domain-containing protein n=1 Tax=Glacieibacterium frigidum TaxID=2593303 RepID=A0A552UHU8_9SPHN|nr:PepSY domain-containing protein [Glacieibacterium frigidum]TRW17798.1 PepSY domain-containing protein [Glacieibacterium frigidum]